MLFALIVGILIGARACAPEAPPAEVEERIVVQESECDCGPDERPAVDAGSTEVAESNEPAEPARPAAKSKGENALPEAPEPRTPAERRQLLAWVREQSSSVQRCSTAAPNTVRTTVTLELGEDGEVRRVMIVDPSGEIDSSTERCLRSEMVKWRPPGELVKQRDRLIFGLML